MQKAQTGNVFSEEDVGMKDALYEALKKEWITAHPDATPEEYQRAIKDIVKHLNI